MTEARGRDGWRPVRAGAVPPQVREEDAIELRGLPPGAQFVTIGRTEVAVDGGGRARLRPMEDEALRGHVGLVPVAVGGQAVGEVEIVPGKMPEAAYLELRADLQRVWGDLVLDPESAAPAAIEAGPPPARELWRRIDHVVMEILASPHEHLRVGVGVRRMERVRHRRELQPAVVRAGVRRRAALTRTLERTTDTPENQLVGATLRLLRNHARREPGADDVVRRIERLLREPVLARAGSGPGPGAGAGAAAGGPLRRVTWGMRSDPRYRQVLSVHQILNRPELAATEGPGELRLGIPALTRLYEYWVFLQVLLAAAARYGPPEPPGFDVASVRLPGGRRRLVLAPGTTVTFPGPVHVAFEPLITARGDGWMGLEYVPHPDPARQQMVATPDVVVFRTGGQPWLTVVDAKYVGRYWVELEAARTHEKYARMRWRGDPVVRHVLVAHPHENLSFQWAGYGSATMRPGRPLDPLPLPLPLRA